MVDTKGNLAVSHCPRAVAWHPSFAERRPNDLAVSIDDSNLHHPASPHPWFFAFDLLNHGIMPVLKLAISTAFKAQGFLLS